MDRKKISILLIEDNPGDAGIIKEILKEIDPSRFALFHEKRLSGGLALLDGGDDPDLILLDLDLPDSFGLDTFSRIRDKAGEIPVIIVSGMAVEMLSMEAVHGGAQDYLVKGSIDAYGLDRSIKYAIERNRQLLELRSMALIDELTELYNRRGFFTVSEQTVKTAERTGMELYLYFVDVDNFKWINDNYGHREGDRVLMTLAELLRNTFRGTDVIARMGGDEFALLTLGTSEDGSGRVIERLYDNLDKINLSGDRPYSIEFSVGCSSSGSSESLTIYELLSRADSSMYEEKKRRKMDIGLMSRHSREKT